MLAHIFFFFITESMLLEYYSLNILLTHCVLVGVHKNLPASVVTVMGF